MRFLKKKLTAKSAFVMRFWKKHGKQKSARAPLYRDGPSASDGPSLTRRPK
jgi:hypothetical protein